MAPLGLLSKGEQAEIVEIKGQQGCGHGSSKNQLCHAEDMGLRVGKTVEVLNNEGKGPLLLKVDESRIAIGRGMAMKILVRRIEV
jgi:ferrous iron transport protein A